MCVVPVDGGLSVGSNHLIARRHEWGPPFVLENVGPARCLYRGVGGQAQGHLVCATDCTYPQLGLSDKRLSAEDGEFHFPQQTRRRAGISCPSLYPCLTSSFLASLSFCCPLDEAPSHSCSTLLLIWYALRSDAASHKPLASTDSTAHSYLVSLLNRSLECFFSSRVSSGPQATTTRRLPAWLLCWNHSRTTL